MKRRDFITAASTMATAGAWAPASRAQTRTHFDPRPGQWRTFEVITRVEIGRTGAGETRVWVPLPSVDDVYQQTLDNQWTGNAGTMQVVSDGRYGASMLFARFDPSVPRPTVEVASRFRTQGRKQDWSVRSAARTDDARFWTAPTDLMPVDGIVRRTAQDITRGRRTDVDKTRALYEWVVANTYREPKVPGCGVGDIKSMLETGNLGGKCGDINALFVGLNRAVGIPARDVYGIRVAPCAFGYKELGAGSATITRAQHCRAEVFLRDHGWVAMDPADVGKVMRLETADWIKDSGHPVVAPVKTALFGGWEGNWLGYNVAHDVALPHSKGPKVGFLMYPQAKNDKGRFDALDPDTFRYTITTRELKTA